MSRGKLLLQDEKVHWMSFNEDGSFLAVGTNVGLWLFSVCPFGVFCFIKEGQGIGSIHFSPSGSLVAATRKLSKKYLFLYNCSRESNQKRIYPPNDSAEFSFSSDVLNATITSSCIILATERAIGIYSLADLRQLHSIQTEPNPTGLFAVCAADQFPLLAFPSLNDAKSRGNVSIYNFRTNRLLGIITAHNNPVARLSISPDGSRLATASIGSRVNVYDLQPILSTLTSEGDPLQISEPLVRFRYPFTSNRLHSLTFDREARFFAIAWTTGYVEVHQLKQMDPNKTPVVFQNTLVAELLRPPFASIRSILTDSPNEMFCCGFFENESFQDGFKRMVLATESGQLHAYRFDAARGGTAERVETEEPLVFRTTGGT